MGWLKISLKKKTLSEVDLVWVKKKTILKKQKI